MESRLKNATLETLSYSYKWLKENNEKLKEQTDAKIAAGRKANPDFMKGVDEIIIKAKAFQLGDNAIKIGEKAPNFELPNP